MRRRALILAGLAVALAGAAVALIITLRDAPLRVGSGTPEASAGGEALTLGRSFAYTSNVAGGWDLWLMEGDGGLRNLTPDGDAHDYFPSWALDGGQINFLSTRGNPAEVGPSQVAPDGSGLRSLSIVQAIFTLVQERRFDWDPGWSPDGTRLLWASLRDLNLELYSIATDGDFEITSATRLTNSSARDWFGAWSPDGTRIAFASDAAGHENIYWIAAEGGERVQLTSNAWDEVRPAWSLDGARLLYVDDREDALARGALRLYVMNADGSDARPLAEDEIFSGGAVWSPDGTQMLYMSNEGGRWQIFLARADGSGATALTPPDSDAIFPVWRP